MDAIMKLQPTNRHGIRLRKRFAKIRSNLFVFVTNRAVPYTNNASERALRPSVVFRKGNQRLPFPMGRPTSSPRSVPSSIPAAKTASPSSSPSAPRLMETPYS